MRRLILPFVLVIIIFGCDSLQPPSTLNYLDPDSPNYIEVKPTNIEIRTLGEQSVKISWDYISTNYELFKVVISNNADNETEELLTEYRNIVISDLDVSKTYTIKVQAVFEDVATQFSESISLAFFNISSFQVSGQKKIMSYGTSKYSVLSPGFQFAAILADELNVLNPNLNFKFETTIASSASEIFFSNDDEYLLIVNTESQLEIWQTDTWTHIKTISEVGTCSPSINNNIVAASNNESVSILELPDGNIVRNLSNYKNTSALRFSDDGQYLVIANSDSQVKIVETTSWNETKSFSVNSGVLSVDISVDNNYLLYTYDKYIDIVNLQTDQIIKSYTSYINNPILQGKFSTNPDVVLLVTGDKLLQIYTGVQLPEQILYDLDAPISNLSKDRSNFRFFSSGFPATYFVLEFIPGGSWHQVN